MAKSKKATSLTNLKVDKEASDLKKEKERIKRAQLKALVANKIGDEPVYTGLPNTYDKIQTIKALNYYSKMGSAKESFDFLRAFIKSNHKELLKKLDSIHPQYITNKGFIIRMIENNFTFEEGNDLVIQNIINFIKDFKINNSDDEQEEVIKDKKQKPKESVDLVMDQLDILIDNPKADLRLDCQPSDYKRCFSYISYLISDISNKIKYVDPDSGKTISEEHYTKPMIKRIQEIYSYLESAINQTRKIKVRKKKKIDPLKMVQNLKFLSKNDNFTSIKPSEIVGKKKLYLFDTKTRRLKCYVTDIEVGFHVRGTSILNVDLEKSFEKVISRKDVPALSSCKAISALNNFFKNISGESKKMIHTRTNDSMIILGCS